MIETKPNAPTSKPEPKPDLSPVPAAAGISEVWGRVRELAGQSRRDRTITSWLTLKSVDENRAVVAVQDPKDYRAAASASERLGELFKQAVGAAVDVLVEAPKGQTIDESTLSENDRKAIEHPLVQEAKDLFDARVVRVERVERNDDV